MVTAQPCCGIIYFQKKLYIYIYVNGPVNPIIEWFLEGQCSVTRFSAVWMLQQAAKQGANRRFFSENGMPLVLTTRCISSKLSQLIIESGPKKLTQHDTTAFRSSVGTPQEREFEIALTFFEAKFRPWIWLKTEAYETDTAHCIVNWSLQTEQCQESWKVPLCTQQVHIGFNGRVSVNGHIPKNGFNGNMMLKNSFGVWSAPNWLKDFMWVAVPKIFCIGSAAW